MVYRNRKTWIFEAGLMLAVLVAAPITAHAGEDEETIGRGAKAWAETCSRCHNMRAPNEFRDDLWRPIVYHMRVRAGLTGQETRDILKFLQESN